MACILQSNTASVLTKFEGCCMVRWASFVTLTLLAISCAVAAAPQQDANSAPLRIFIRAGVKTHGPGEHDLPAFLKSWTELLRERGVVVDGALEFPTAAQLEKTDVLVMFAAEAGTVAPDDRANLESFTKRGGGIVAI